MLGFISDLNKAEALLEWHAQRLRPQSMEASGSTRTARVRCLKSACGTRGPYVESVEFAAAVAALVDSVTGNASWYQAEYRDSIMFYEMGNIIDFFVGEYRELGLSQQLDEDGVKDAANQLGVVLASFTECDV